MNIINVGDPRTIRLLAGQTISVTTTGTITATCVSGLGLTAGATIGSIHGSTVFGSYSADGVIKLTATNRDGAYELNTDTTETIKSVTGTTGLDVLDAGSRQAADHGIFSNKPTAAYVYADLSIGSVVPTTTGDGAAIAYSGAAAPSKGAEGLSINTGTGQRALYAEVTLPAPVKHMEAEFKFSGGSGGAEGSIVLVPWKTTNANFPVSAVPATGIHMVVRKDATVVSYFDAGLGGYTTYLTKKHAQPLSDNVWYRAGWSLVDSRLSIKLPDGTVTVVTEANIASRLGPFACWEIYQFDGAADQKVTIRKISATHADPVLAGIPFDNTPKAETVPVCVSETTGATASVPLSAAALLPALAAVRVPKGETGKCNIRLGAWVSANPAGTVVWVVQLYLDAAATLTYGNESRLVADAGQLGQATVDILMTLPAEPVYMKWQQWGTAAGATMDVQAYRPAVMVLTPV